MPVRRRLLLAEIRILLDGRGIAQQAETDPCSAASTCRKLVPGDEHSLVVSTMFAVDHDVDA